MSTINWRMRKLWLWLLPCYKWLIICYQHPTFHIGCQRDRSYKWQQGQSKMLRFKVKYWRFNVYLVLVYVLIHSLIILILAIFQNREHKLCRLPRFICRELLVNIKVLMRRYIKLYCVFSGYSFLLSFSGKF